jgi:hypothetical protein
MRNNNEDSVRLATTPIQMGETPRGHSGSSAQVDAGYSTP